jgi:hypothetical protein
MITGAPAVGEQGNSKILSNIADIFTQGPAAAMPDAGMGGFAFRLGNFAISIVDLITKTIPLPGAGGTGAIVPPPLPTNNQHVITSEKDTPFMPAEPPHASHDHPIKLVFSYGADGTVAGTVKGAEVRHARDTPRNTPASKAHTTRSPMPSGTPNGR